jgi:chromosome segregation ATPase
MDITYSTLPEDNFQIPLHDLQSVLKSSNQNILELKEYLKRVLAREEKLVQEYSTLQQRFHFMRCFYTSRQNSQYANFYKNTHQLQEEYQKLAEAVENKSEGRKQMEHTITVLKERLDIEEKRVKTLEDEISQYNNTLIKAKDTLNYLRSEKIKLDEKMQNRIQHKDEEISALKDKVELLNSQVSDKERSLLETERELQFTRDRFSKTEGSYDEIKRLQERVSILELENIEVSKENKILKEKVFRLKQENMRELTASSLSHRSTGRYTPDKSYLELLKLKEEYTSLNNRFQELENERESFLDKEHEQVKQIKQLASMLDKMNRKYEEAMYKVEQNEIQLKTYQHSARRQENYYDKEQNELIRSYQSKIQFYESNSSSLQDAITKLRSENISLNREKETYLTRFRMSEREQSEWKHGLCTLLIEFLDLDSTIISDIENILEIEQTLTLSPDIKQSISQVRSLIESSKLLNTLDRYKLPLSPETRRFMNTMRSSDSFIESPIISPSYSGGDFYP